MFQLDIEVEPPGADDGGGRVGEGGGGSYPAFEALYSPALDPAAAAPPTRRHAHALPLSANSSQ